MSAYDDQRSTIIKQRTEENKAFPGLSVRVKPGQFDRAFRKFKKKVQEDGKLQKLREYEFYEKPSVRKKRNKDIAKKRWQRQVEEDSINKKRLY